MGYEFGNYRPERWLIVELKPSIIGTQSVG
jgi:hypothetical protein